MRSVMLLGLVVLMPAAMKGHAEPSAPYNAAAYRAALGEAPPTPN